jgi:hypothetical protein
MAGQLNRRRCGRRAALVTTGVVADGTVLEASDSTLRQAVEELPERGESMSRPTRMTGLARAWVDTSTRSHLFDTRRGQ